MPLPETPSTDLSLLDRVRERDDEAWACFVDLYSPVVLYWCRRQGLSAADREDVFQEVSRALLTGLRGFRKEAEHQQFRRYLWTVTLNKIRDLRRRAEPVQLAERGAWLAFDQRLAALDDEERSDTTPADVLILRPILKQVEARLTNPRSMEVLNLLVIDGWSAAEVAQRFGMTENAVRRTRARMLQMIRAEYKEFLPP